MVPQNRREDDEACPAQLNYALAFKAKVALIVLKGERALAEFAQFYDVHQNQITAWKAQLVEGAAGLFGGAAAVRTAPTVDLKSFHAKT